MRAFGWVLVFLLIGGLAMGPVLIAPADRLAYPAHGLFSDLTLTHWSAFEYARDQLSQTGQIPLWRTSILSGTPFAPNPLAGLFYPPHWLTLWPALPMALALNVLLWLHFSLAAASMYALMRRWQVKRTAALVSALAFAAAPKIVAHMGLGHLTLVEAWAWLPMVLYPLPVPLSFARPSTSASSRSEHSASTQDGGFVLSGAALGLCVLADARMAIYAGALAVTYVIAIGARRERRARLNAIGRIVIIGIVAASISAAAWLPTLDLTASASRSSLAASEAGTLSLDPIYLLGLLIPDRSGAAERTTFVGWSVLALAVLALFSRRTQSSRLRFWLLGVLVVGVLIALGTHTPLYDLLSRLPGASLLRVPARAWFVVTFAFAVLAGFGWQVVDERLKPKRYIISAAIVIGLIAIDLLAADWSVYRVTTVDEAFAAGREVAAAISNEAQGFRVYSPSLSIPQHVAQQFGLHLADGVDPLQLTRYVKFMQAATGLGSWNYSVTLPPFPGIQSDADVHTALKTVMPNTALLGLLNVKYIVADFPLESSDLIESDRAGGTSVYENHRVLPRAFMVNRIEVATSIDQAARWLVNGPLDQAAIVEGLPFPFELNAPNGKAHIISQQADRITATVTGPGLLVLSEVYSPDWTATVDGELTAIYPTDVALRGVFGPWGTHTIEMVYRPWRVYAGALISILSLIACAGAWLIQRARRSASHGA